MGFFSNLFKKTDTSKLQEALDAGAFLVDVRTAAEFAEGSVAGAVNIPLGNISQQLGKFKNKSAVVVFCRSGSRRSLAKSVLEKNGIEHVINGRTWQTVQQLIK